MSAPLEGRPSQTGNDRPHGHASFLFIHYKDNHLDSGNPDNGQRPFGGLPPGTVFYLSPDITVSPTDVNGNVRVGTDVTVKARIFNNGELDAVGVYVEFWWFNPTLAFTAAAANQRIGTKIVNIPRNNYVDVECPNKWQPIFVNGGHECLVVQLSSPSEGADDLKFAFAAALDRHVGQKNLMVQYAPSANKLQLAVGNPFRSAEAFTVRLSTLLVGGDIAELRALDMGEVIGLVGRAAVGGPGDDGRPSSGRRPRLEVTDITGRGLGVRLLRSRETMRLGQNPLGEDLASHLRARALAGPDFDAETLGRTLAQFVLAPDAGRILEFELTPTETGAEHFVVHRFTQVVAKCDIGGYTVVVPSAHFVRGRESPAYGHPAG